MEEVIKYLQSIGFFVKPFSEDCMCAQLSNQSDVMITINNWEGMYSIWLDHKTSFRKTIISKIRIESVDMLQIILKNSLCLKEEFDDLFQ